MDAVQEKEISHVISQFAIYGDLVSFKPLGNGHINNTYRSTFSQGGARVRYTHQRINKEVFKQPDQVVSNIAAVTDFLRESYQKEGLEDISRRTLTLVPCKASDCRTLQRCPAHPRFQPSGQSQPAALRGTASRR